MRVVWVISLAAAALLLAAVGYAESWNQIPAPDEPSARYGHSLVELDDGRVLMFGGEDYRGDLQNSICGYKPESNTWVPMPVVGSPPARLGASLTQISDHELALYGGMGTAGPLGDLWILDLDSGEWRKVAVGGAPPPRGFHVAFHYQGNLYIAGGMGEGGKPRRDAWAYDFETGVWSRRSDAPEDLWGAYATVYCRPRCSAYVLGPVSLVYDPAEDTWRHSDATGNLPPAKYLAAFARNGDRIDMLGGLYTAGGRVYSTPCHFSYDLKSGAWTYYHSLAAPFQDTGLWGAQAFWQGDTLRLWGGAKGWNCPDLPLNAFLEKLPSLANGCWKWNETVYGWHP